MENGGETSSTTMAAAPSRDLLSGEENNNTAKTEKNNDHDKNVNTTEEEATPDPSVVVTATVPVTESATTIMAPIQSESIDLLRFNNDNDNNNHNININNNKGISATNGNGETRFGSDLLNMTMESTTSHIENPTENNNNNNSPAPELFSETPIKATNTVNNNMNNNKNDNIAELQSNLEQQMNLKADVDNQLYIAQSTIQELEWKIDSQNEKLKEYESIEDKFIQEKTTRIDIENKMRDAYERINILEREKQQQNNDIEQLHKDIQNIRKDNIIKENEIKKIQIEKDEHERQRMAITIRLNELMKKDAIKVNLQEEFEDDLKITLDELDNTKNELQKVTNEKLLLQNQFNYEQQISKEKIKHLEKLLSGEKQLNDNRKNKMKEFIDKKQQEIHQLNDDNNSLQIELTQTNKSLVELNTRLKQLHNQYIQTQQRNRELQRDIIRIKKDTENLHKQGDTLEMKLNKSNNETEEHKNKRIAAKQELMSVLRALDNERDTTTKLRDKIKLLITPKVLIQQQALNECLDEFDATLQRLSTRLGKPIPPPIEDLNNDSNNRDSTDTNDNNTNNNNNNNEITNIEIANVVNKLEVECQKVTNTITTVSNNVERLRAMIEASGDRTCFTVLTELVATGGTITSPALQEEGRAMTGGGLHQRHGYGHV